VAARFAAEVLAPQPAAWSRQLDGLVLSSPALDAGLSGLQQLLLAVAGSLAPGLAVSNGLKPDWISRDPAVVKAYAADPLVHDRITARLTRFIVDGGRRVIGDAPRWALPTLLMWAEADRCVAPRGSEAFAAAAPANVVATQPWKGLFHEIFNEPEKAAVLKTLTDWLNR
jgi:alpha-beta hydrolase superfamily lysophospholipase